VDREDNVFKPATIPALFAERVSLHGQHPALAYKNSKADADFTQVSWSEYFTSAMGVAKALIAVGVHPGDTVNILAFNHQNWYYTCFGSIFAGAVVAGMYLTNTADAVQYQLAHSKTKVLFVDSAAQLDKALQVKARCPALEYIVMWPNNLDGAVAWRSFL
jgi:long-chain-fatty-acid--CoA ligase ACSBG